MSLAFTPDDLNGAIWKNVIDILKQMINFRLEVGWGVVGGNIKYTHSIGRNAVSIL
mgnify:CR=1